MNLDPAPNSTSIRLARSQKWFDLANPTAAMVTLEDIAFGLSNVTRFAGQVRTYSVAQHSVLCARQAADATRLRMLLHDAGEAYAHDISRPLKRMLPGYQYVEAQIWKAICGAFGLDRPDVTFLDGMKDIDNRMLRTEARDLLFDGHEPPIGYPEVPCYTFKIVPWSPERAEAEFVEEFWRTLKVHRREEELCRKTPS